MFAIEGIDHIVLNTTCIDKMIEFYCNLLQCQIENKQPELGLTQLRAGNQLIDLVEVSHPISQDNLNLNHFCLNIKPFDFDLLKAYFEQNNVSISRYGERYGARGMRYSFYLKDPEGNEIELRDSMH
jgi:glyoxylase I family protein